MATLDDLEVEDPVITVILTEVHKDDTATVQAWQVDRRPDTVAELDQVREKLRTLWGDPCDQTIGVIARDEGGEPELHVQLDDI
ncbi:hypothetical protein ACIBQX_11215 [Nonomuraea sp. NPDC049714]|uniref:hypothetical protein n=1 Tax=Nonomuraea sp. NPDC049714 TaxID=3364357 RepID=UPI0037A3FA65